MLSLIIFEITHIFEWQHNGRDDAGHKDNNTQNREQSSTRGKVHLRRNKNPSQ